jgi:hypothetical protein
MQDAGYYALAAAVTAAQRKAVAAKTARLRSAATLSAARVAFQRPLYGW